MGGETGAIEQKESSFEHLVQELENIVTRLESSDLPLEEAIDAYQKGVRLAKEGHARLAQAEKRIEEVTQSGETRVLDSEAFVRPENEV